MAADVPIARADSKKIVECISSDEKVKIGVVDFGPILGGSEKRNLTYTTSVFIFCERLAIRNNHVRKKRTTMESIGFTASTPGQKLIRT